MKRVLVFISLSIIATACTSKEQTKVGGPCSYTTAMYPAIVISIDTGDIVNVWCSIENPHSDTVDYFSSNNRYASLAAIEQAKLKLGDTLIYQHRHITDGTCTPDIFNLLLKEEVANQ